MQKLLTFFSKNSSIYAILNDQSFIDTYINDIVSFEQLGPGKIAFETYHNRNDPDQQAEVNIPKSYVGKS